MASSGPSRSLYFGNISPAVTYYDVCKLANVYGNLELVKIVPQKKCAFVNFVREECAQRLFDETKGSVELCGQRVVVGWAKTTPIRPEIQTAIDEGATRNLFVAGIGGATEHMLSSVFLGFGDIENIVCVPRKGFGFVNMTSIKTALDAKTACETQGIEIAGRKLTVKWAKEGVPARDPRTVTNQPQYPQPLHEPPRGFMPHQPQPHQQQQHFMPPHAGMPLSGGSRAIYLGNLAEEVSNREICKLGNKFGALELVRMNKEKKTAFINFIEASAAEAMFHAAQARPLVLHNAEVKVGWAKSARLRPEIQEAIQHGATRNLYVGGISENVTEDMLRKLIAPYCHDEFDGIHILHEKKIAFVNLLSIKAAMWAKQALTSAEEPIVLDNVPIKINFAKEHVGGGGFMGMGGPVHRQDDPMQYQQQVQQVQPQHTMQYESYDGGMGMDYDVTNW